MICIDDFLGIDFEVIMVESSDDELLINSGGDELLINSANN
jgi:hypothetical protein